MLPEHQFTGRFGTCHVYDEAGEQPLQVETAIEAISEGGEVAVGVLSVIYRVKRAPGRLQMAQRHVHPLELPQVRPPLPRRLRLSLQSPLRLAGAGRPIFPS